MYALQSGGLSWKVPTGRRDGRVSQTLDVNNLPAPDDSVDVQKQKFEEKGLNTQDLVTLVGKLTHKCMQYSKVIYHIRISYH
jgi:peroxidase